MSGTYYHGGVAGLRRGDYLLPPAVHGGPTCADHGAEGVCRRDRVYATNDLGSARVFAALRGRGNVYEVELTAPIEPDGDYVGDDPDFSVCASSGRILRVVEYAVPLAVAREELATFAAAVDAEAGRRSQPLSALARPGVKENPCRRVAAQPEAINSVQTGSSGRS